LTLKFCVLVAVPPGVVTLIRPVVALAGTVARTDVAETTVKVAASVPLNFTEVAPVRFVPVIVTVVPTRPLPGENEEIVGAGVTAVTSKLDELVAVPPAVVTSIGPSVAPLGTVAVIDVADSTVKDALVPLNVTDDAPVKFVPVIVTPVPTGPLVGVNDEMVGADGGGVEAQPGSWNELMRVCQLFPVEPRSVVGVAFVYSPTYQKVQPSAGSMVIAL